MNRRERWTELRAQRDQLLLVCVAITASGMALLTVGLVVIGGWIVWGALF